MFLVEMFIGYRFTLKKHLILFFISAFPIHGGEMSEEGPWIPKAVNSKTEFMGMPIPLLKEKPTHGHSTHKNIETT